MTNTWYVYSHTSPSGKVYIGITSNLKVRWSNRGYRYTTYNSLFKRAISKYGWDNIKHDIILSNISKREACYAERYLIKWYKLHNLSYNITDGGEGTVGRAVSEETREKMRSSAKGFPQSAYDSRRASEKAKEQSRINITVAQKCWKGGHHTQESKDKIREKAKKYDIMKAVKASAEKARKKVLAISPSGDKLIFESMSDAAKFLSTNPSNIGRAMKRNLKVKKHKIYLYEPIGNE